ncbi:MAG: hypothetical protein AOA65_0387 [Candidatus Bathyarchaeota archaeon BA1]|nr:MAG: hypothetical protein AOA65_0387 [Candidatus Bathyarchaeota archaeon BA1]
MIEGEGELMSEKKPSLEDLLQRIDMLLDVLNTISGDLMEISKALKAMGVPAALPTEMMRTIEDVQALFPKDLGDMLTFEEVERYIIIKPRQYLGSENFSKIASIIRSAGGEYISAGRESHFRVPRAIR